MRQAIVIGGGIGGLTVAIALRQAGIEATLFERAGELREVGAGVALASNAIRGLSRLGLADEVRRFGVIARRHEIRSWRGALLSGLSLMEVWERIGAESAAVHRADLQSLLLRTLGKGALRLGARCAKIEQDASGVVARFADGREARGDILIGADGLRSFVRSSLFGEGKPRYAGFTAWRGITDLEHEPLPPGLFFESWGRGAIFGMAHVAPKRVYWYATKNAPEGGDDEPLGPRRALLEMFRGWHEPVEALIGATDDEAIRRDDIYDREPLKTWSRGRVTLLGDAAHPMTPNLGQGACQAIEDAVALADCLGTHGDPAVALRAYEERRIDRANAIAKQSRFMGRINQLENPIACRMRDLAIKLMPDGLRLRQLEWIIDHEA